MINNEQLFLGKSIPKQLIRNSINYEYQLIIWIIRIKKSDVTSANQYLLFTLEKYFQWMTLLFAHETFEIGGPPSLSVVVKYLMYIYTSGICIVI